jgi:hypothetical protein
MRLLGLSLIFHVVLDMIEYDMIGTTHHQSLLFFLPDNVLMRK